jgi:imidazolonepropionase-like amidohydrolase
MPLRRWVLGAGSAHALGRLACLLLVLVSCQHTPPHQAAPPASGPIVFRDVAVFVGTGDTLLEHQDVVVEGEKILSVGPTGTAAATGEVIDGAGKTLLPGYVDAHTHILNGGVPNWAPIDIDARFNLKAWLSAGVTRVFDLGGMPGDIKDLRAEMQDGVFDGPDVSFCALPGTGKDGHPLPLLEAEFSWPLFQLIKLIYPQLETEEDAREFVDDTAAEGANAIKLMFDRIPTTGKQMDPKVLKAAIDAAHDRQLKVFVHVGTVDDALVACRAGADVLAHMPYRGAIQPSQAAELAQRQCPVVATLAAWYAVDALSENTFTPSVYAQRWGAPEQLAALATPQPPPAQVEAVFIDVDHMTDDNRQHWAANAKTLYDAGVPLLIGTDAPLPGILAGSGYHEELQALHAAGIPSGYLLQRATRGAAETLWETPDHSTVLPGAPADLVLVDGDPVADITRAAEVLYVLREGRVVRRPPAP